MLCCSVCVVFLWCVLARQAAERVWWARSGVCVCVCQSVCAGLLHVRAAVCVNGCVTPLC